MVEKIADLVAASQTSVEVEVRHVNEVEFRTPPKGSGSTDPFSERRRLVDESEVVGAQPIAMSCRPRSLLRHALTGSVSQAVIMRAGCPVMVVREPGFRL